MEPAILPKLVLLADNDLDFLDSFAELLDGTRRYRVLKARSPDEARSIIEFYPDLAAVLLDIRLTNDSDVRDTSGLDVAECIPGSIPYLFLSASCRNETRKLVWDKTKKVIQSKTADPRLRVDAVDALFNLVA